MFQEHTGALKILRGDVPAKERLAHLKKYCDAPTFEFSKIQYQDATEIANFVSDVIASIMKEKPRTQDQKVDFANGFNYYCTKYRHDNANFDINLADRFVLKERELQDLMDCMRSFIFQAQRLRASTLRNESSSMMEGEGIDNCIAMIYEYVGVLTAPPKAEEGPLTSKDLPGKEASIDDRLTFLGNVWRKNADYVTGPIVSKFSAFVLALYGDVTKSETQENAVLVAEAFNRNTDDYRKLFKLKAVAQWTYQDKNAIIEATKLPSVSKHSQQLVDIMRGLIRDAEFYRNSGARPETNDTVKYVDLIAAGLKTFIASKKKVGSAPGSPDSGVMVEAVETKTPSPGAPKDSAQGGALDARPGKEGDEEDKTRDLAESLTQLSAVAESASSNPVLPASAQPTASKKGAGPTPGSPDSGVMVEAVETKTPSPGAPKDSAQGQPLPAGLGRKEGDVGAEHKKPSSPGTAKGLVWGNPLAVRLANKDADEESVEEENPKEDGEESVEESVEEENPKEDSEEKKISPPDSGEDSEWRRRFLENLGPEENEEEKAKEIAKNLAELEAAAKAAPPNPAPSISAYSIAIPVPQHPVPPPSGQPSAAPPSQNPALSNPSYPKPSPPPSVHSSAAPPSQNPALSNPSYPKPSPPPSVHSIVVPESQHAASDYTRSALNEGKKKEEKNDIPTIMQADEDQATINSLRDQQNRHQLEEAGRASFALDDGPSVGFADKQRREKDDKPFGGFADKQRREKDDISEPLQPRRAHQRMRSYVSLKTSKPKTEIHDEQKDQADEIRRVVDRARRLGYNMSNPKKWQFSSRSLAPTYRLTGAFYSDVLVKLYREEVLCPLALLILSQEYDYEIPWHVYSGVWTITVNAERSNKLRHRSHFPSSISAAPGVEMEMEDLGPNRYHGMEMEDSEPNRDRQTLLDPMSGLRRRIKEHDEQRAKRQAAQDTRHEVQFSPSVALSVRPVSGPPVQSRATRRDDEEKKEPTAKSSSNFFPSSVSAAPNNRPVHRFRDIPNIEFPTAPRTPRNRMIINGRFV